MFEKHTFSILSFLIQNKRRINEKNYCKEDEKKETKQKTNLGIFVYFDFQKKNDRLKGTHKEREIGVDFVVVGEARQRQIRRFFFSVKRVCILKLTKKKNKNKN